MCPCFFDVLPLFRSTGKIIIRPGRVVQQKMVGAPWVPHTPSPSTASSQPRKTPSRSTLTQRFKNKFSKKKVHIQGFKVSKTKVPKKAQQKRFNKKESACVARTQAEKWRVKSPEFSKYKKTQSIRRCAKKKITITSKRSESLKRSKNKNKNCSSKKKLPFQGSFPGVSKGPQKEMFCRFGVAGSLTKKKKKKPFREASCEPPGP